MIEKVFILPTGDEIKNGTVRDLDAPEIMSLVVREFPEAEVTRVCPLLDTEDTIFRKIVEAAESKPDLIILIGGSGGGHRFSKTLGKDYTHTALSHYLDEYASHEIYGKNGHMWSKLVCGKKDGTIVINVPGPFVEAKAAAEAFLSSYEEGVDLEEVALAMANAVLAQYPVSAAEVK
ncbi:MAG: molybdopterin-binding protein [Eubacteriales bacterium]|nr:molybdopterin-binding protein [Eubacteriales bacterium]